MNRGEAALLLLELLRASDKLLTHPNMEGAEYKEFRRLFQEALDTMEGKR